MKSIFRRCLLLLLFPVSPGWGADNNTLFNQIHINAQVERYVENDQLEVSMAVEKQGNKPEDIAAEVNETMQWALAGKVSVADITHRRGGSDSSPTRVSRR